MASPQSTLPNDEKEAQDSHYNPGEQHARELTGSHEAIPNYDRSSDGLDNHPDFNGSGNEPPDSAAGVRDAEDSGGNWKSNYGGNKSKGGKTLSGSNVRAILKKRGPLGLIALLGLGGGLVGVALFSPGLILVQMKESLVDRFDTQFSSSSVRSTKILNQKILGATSGVCGSKITVMCKYSTISEKQQARLKEAGIEVKGDSKFGNRIKPTSYSFNGGADMDAKKFAQLSATDTDLRSALRKAYNPRYANFADKVWTKVATKLGVTKQRALPDGDTAAKTKALNDEVKNGTKLDISNDGVTCKGDTCTDAEGRPLSDAQKAARQAAIDASQAAVDEGAESAAESAISGIEDGAKTGVTSVANFVKLTGFADTACQAYSSVRALGFAAKTVRAIQLARYAMVFVNTADQIKAGTAKPEDVAYLGGILTNLAYDAKSGAKRQAAMDSAGMKYALSGDTSGFRGAGSSYVSQFMAGGGLTGDLISVTDYINSVLGPPGTAKATCATLSNGWVQAGSVIAGIGLMLVPGANVVIGISDVAKGALSIAAGIGMAVLPDLLKSIVAGNVTQGLVGEDAGNAIASGFGVIASDTAQAGGNAPMGVSDAVAYTTTNNEAIAADTQEEAKTLSPLDASNKDTFLGSIVSKLLPFASSDGTISNPLSAFGSMASSSLASIIPTSSALSTAQTQAAYTSCTDPDYSSLGIAADPFCNPVFGIPQQFVNKDPIQVATDLAGQYDDSTGAPLPNTPYSTFVTNCIERTDPLGSNGADGSNPSDGSECKINSSNADYYLFYMDQRVDTDMDGLDDGSDNTPTDPTNTTSYNPSTLTSVGDITNTDSVSLAAFITPSESYSVLAAPQSAKLTPDTTRQISGSQLNQNWYWLGA